MCNPLYNYGCIHIYTAYTVISTCNYNCTVYVLICLAIKLLLNKKVCFMVLKHLSMHLKVTSTYFSYSQTGVDFLTLDAYFSLGHNL